MTIFSFPGGGSDSKESACNAGDLGLILGWGRSPGEGNGNPFQYSCLENPTDRGAWGGLQSMGLQRVRCHWAPNTFSLFRKWVISTAPTYLLVSTSRWCGGDWGWGGLGSRSLHMSPGHSVFWGLPLFSKDWPSQWEFPAHRRQRRQRDKALGR